MGRELSGTRNSDTQVARNSDTQVADYIELENKLFLWFTSRLEAGQAVVTDKLLREKALEIATELKQAEFKASPN